MGEKNDQKGLEQAEEDVPSSESKSAQQLPKEARSPTGTPWTKPGHIPDPQEKDWDTEAADPYEGIERTDPFEGRPPSQVPSGSVTLHEPQDPGPGQPRPAQKKQE